MRLKSSDKQVNDLVDYVLRQANFVVTQTVVWALQGTGWSLEHISAAAYWAADKLTEINLTPLDEEQKSDSQVDRETPTDKGKVKPAMAVLADEISETSSSEVQPDEEPVEEEKPLSKVNRDSEAVVETAEVPDGTTITQKSGDTPQ